jgi:hypothetical protein
MASCGDMGGKGTPRLGGRPGLELNSENKLFFIRLTVEVSSQSPHRKCEAEKQYRLVS